MISYQLDTNVLLRYLTQDIPAQGKRVDELFDKAKRHEIELEVSEPVFIETTVTLRNYFKFPKDRVVSLLEALLSLTWIHFENYSYISQAIPLFAKKDLDLIDCLIFLRAKTNNQKIFTFDAKLADTPTKT